MVFEEFNLLFTFRGKELIAKCHHYHFFSKYTQIWVYVDTKSLKLTKTEMKSNAKPEYKVYLFYIINYAKRELFSYELERCSHQSELILFRGIAEAIEQVLLQNWRNISSLAKDPR
jgi:hypothetical protein